MHADCGSLACRLVGLAMKACLKRPVAVCVILALALFVGSCEQDAPGGHYKRPADATTPFENRHEPQRMKEVAEVALRNDIDLVFFGDSITDGWKNSGRAVWEKFYGNRRAANFGIGMAETGNLLWRINAGHFDVIQPRLIVLMIGTNNTEYGKHSPQQIADGIAAVIDSLRERQPEARILLLGIFPRGKIRDDPSRLNNEAVNQFIARIADGKQVVFRDIGAVFLKPDGSVDPELMADSVHLNAQGYRRWAEAIEDDVRRLLGEMGE
jgi:lysophospholipase L1-like esterase